MGACALVLFILSFLKIWAKVEVSGAGELDAFGIDTTQRFSAWDAYGILVKIGIILALVVFALVVARAANMDLPVPWGTTYLALSGVTLLAMLLAVLIGPDESGSGSFLGVSVEISRGLGTFIGAILALGMAAGAWLANSAEGSAAPASAMPTTPTTPTTPPPTSGPTPPAP